MTRRARTAALVALASLVVLSIETWPGAAAAGSMRFRYRLRPGASYTSSMKTSLGMQLEAEGLPGDLAALVTAGKDIQQEMKAEMLLDVGAAGDDGTLPIEGRFQDMYVRMKMGGQVMETSDLKEKLSQLGSLKGSVSSEGQIVGLHLEGGEMDLPGPSRDMMSRMLQVLPTLPDREMKVGDSFEVPMRFDMPSLPGGGGGNLDGTCTYTLRSLAEREAGFDVRCSMSAKAGAAYGNTNVSMKGGTRGTAVFDLEEGIFTRMHTDLALDMAVDMKAQEEAAEPPAKEGEDKPAEPQVMKIRASAKGPTDFSMGRVVGKK